MHRVEEKARGEWMTPLFRHKELIHFCERIFQRLGFSQEDSRIASEAIVHANLQGVDSHGISRLPVYGKRIQEGRINANPQISFQNPTESILLIDGDNGLGQVVATRAIYEGMVKAKEIGVAIIGVKKSNHLGAASYYCEKACAEGLISIAFTNSPPGIVPFGGKQAFFGTNPIAIGIPTGTDTPILIDMSTSVISRGKIILAAKENQPIPSNWAINKEGIPTTNAEEALEGALLPVGGVKGSLLAMAVEIFSGILTGAAYGPHVQSLFADDHGPANVGHFFILIDIRPFMSLLIFHTLVQQFIQELKEVSLAEGIEEILYPGERRRREYVKRLGEGIPMPESVLFELRELAIGLEVPELL
jgi:LDH2 family malate/lactate/ureidoglycolate dehydrogenase